MTKKQRIDAVFQGHKPDYIPAAFYYHFPKEKQFGKESVQAHLGLYKKTDPDFLKIMTENKLQTDVVIKKPEDWLRIKPITGKEKYMQNQVDIVKAIADTVGHETYLFATIHGAFISAFHMTKPKVGDLPFHNLVSIHLKENPEPVLRALKIVSEGLIIFIEKLIEAGADGIYYAALGAESYRFTEEQFCSWIKPYDLTVLQAADKKAPVGNILHMCKNKLNMNVYADYPGAVANWAIHEDNLSLLEGKSLFNRPILGGLDDRSGVLVDGSKQEITQEVHRLITEFGTTGYILGADCTLPTDIDITRIRTAIEAARSYTL